MNFVQFKQIFSPLKVFSLSSVLATEPSFDRRRLHEWQKRGYITKIIKGYYVFSDQSQGEADLFFVANRIYKPSYVSLESALAYYHLIPEAIYGTTSVSTKRTYQFDSGLGSFSYRTLARNLFFGYQMADQEIRIASPSKAVLDFLYLNPKISNGGEFASLRLNSEVFKETLMEKEYFSNVARYNKNALSQRAKDLWEWMKNV